MAIRPSEFTAKIVTYFSAVTPLPHPLVTLVCAFLPRECAPLARTIDDLALAIFRTQLGVRLILDHAWVAPDGALTSRNATAMSGNLEVCIKKALALGARIYPPIAIDPKKPHAFADFIPLDCSGRSVHCVCETGVLFAPIAAQGLTRAGVPTPSTSGSWTNTDPVLLPPVSSQRALERKSLSHTLHSTFTIEECRHYPLSLAPGEMEGIELRARTKGIRAVTPLDLLTPDQASLNPGVFGRLIDQRFQMGHTHYLPHIVRGVTVVTWGPSFHAQIFRYLEVAEAHTLDLSKITFVPLCKADDPLDDSMDQHTLWHNLALGIQERFWITTL